MKSKVRINFLTRDAYNFPLETTSKGKLRATPRLSVRTAKILYIYIYIYTLLLLCILPKTTVGATDLKTYYKVDLDVLVVRTGNDVTICFRSAKILVQSV